MFHTVAGRNPFEIRSHHFKIMVETITLAVSLEGSWLEGSGSLRLLRLPCSSGTEKKRETMTKDPNALRTWEGASILV